MSVPKNNLDQAIAALLLSRGSHPAACNFEADVDNLLAALDAAVPEGYALVPVEPTEAMIVAAREHHEGDHYLPVSLWRAMLAAAERAQGDRNEQ